MILDGDVSPVARNLSKGKLLVDIRGKFAHYFDEDIGNEARHCGGKQKYTAPIQSPEMTQPVTLSIPVTEYDTLVPKESAGMMRQ